jgi:hypothetical protein
MIPGVMNAKYLPGLLLACAVTLPPSMLGASAPAKAESIAVEPVWSGHPVGFCLLTHPPFQWVAYYDAERRMSVAQRTLDSTNWTFHKLPSTLGWDSHNYVAMALDRDGFLHVAGNMHCVPLVYFRSEKPREAASLQRVSAMTGRREGSVTYPVFLHDRAGRLVFRYRDGRSGSGDDLYNVYDEASQSWHRLVEEPLTSGHGRMNAYCSVPTPGPDGRFHMVWVWRDSPDCASNHDISYARSDDLVHWTDSTGRPLALPITSETGDIVDPVPPKGGLINVNRELGFDNAGRPVITYHKYDAHGDLQIYAARHETQGWQIVQVSDWTGYRWNFSGGGSIIVEVKVGAVRPLGRNRLALSYRYPKGSGVWVLDEKTLRPVPGATAPREPSLVPPSLARVQSKFPGMQKQIRNDVGETPAGTLYALTWETLAANRDRPRNPPLPEPSLLSVIRLTAKAPSASIDLPAASAKTPKSMPSESATMNTNPASNQWPCPPSPVIQSISWAPKETIRRAALGSDRYPMTWADDDAQYTAWCDGNGFGNLKDKLSLGFARITGSPERYPGGFAVCDAPEPWGPWTTAFLTSQWDVGPGESANFPTRWMSADGKKLWLVFSGDDSFALRAATLTLKPIE